MLDTLIGWTVFVLFWALVILVLRRLVLSFGSRPRPETFPPACPHPHGNSERLPMILYRGERWCLSCFRTEQPAAWRELTLWAGGDSLARVEERLQGTVDRFRRRPQGRPGAHD